MICDLNFVGVPQQLRSLQAVPSIRPILSRQQRSHRHCGAGPEDISAGTWEAATAGHRFVIPYGRSIYGDLVDSPVFLAGGQIGYNW